MHLRLARKLAGITQEELAKRSGVTNSFISLLESNKRNVQAVAYETVVRMAHALGVEPTELFPVEPLPPVEDDTTQQRTA